MSGTPTEPRITLAGIKLRPRIGVTPGERRQPQSCEADVTLWGDFEPAAHTDALDKTVDYSSVLTVVLDVAHAEEYNLIEALAHSIARRVRQRFPVRRVGVLARQYTQTQKKPAIGGGAFPPRTWLLFLVKP